MRLRVRYSKYGKVRFASHRDMARVIERALRRVKLPVATTEGFTPRPKLHFGLALPTGLESDEEYFDIDLIEGATVDLQLLTTDLTGIMPVGVVIEHIDIVDKSLPSLQEAVTRCTWRFEFDDIDTDKLALAVEKVLASESLVISRERKGKKVDGDLRPGIIALEVVGPTENGIGSIMDAVLATQPRAVRPNELLLVFDPPLHAARIRRTHQWLAEDAPLRESVGSR